MSRCSHAMLLSLDTGSFRSNNHRLVPREHACLHERHNFLRFSRGNLLNIFYIFYLREETTPGNSEPENGEKSSFICNRHRDNLYSRGIFPRKNYFTGCCCSVCYGKFEFWGSQSAAAQGVPRIRKLFTSRTKTLLLLPIICKEFTITLFSKGPWKKVVISFREPTSSPSWCP